MSKTVSTEARAVFERQLNERHRVEVRTRIASRVCQILLLFGLLGGWQAAVWLGYAKPIFVGSPIDIAIAFWNGLASGQFWRECAATLTAVSIAFVSASAAGIGAGVLLHEVRFAQMVLSPFIAGFNSMPRIALAPLTIVWFGLGLASKVALAFSLVVFIVLITTEAALRNVDGDLLRLCRSLGASKIKTLFAIKLPWALPGIFAGLRLGLLYAIISVIVNEMISSPNGLGQLISLYSNTFQISEMFAVLIFLSIITVAADAALQRLEKAFEIW